MIVNLYSEDRYAKLAEQNGWKTDSEGTVTVHNHEHTVKSRNIEEKLDFSRWFLFIIQTGSSGKIFYYTG